MAHARQGTSYSDPRFGVIQRAFTVPQTKDDVATVGTLVEAFINLPTKASIRGFGMMSAASDVVLAANDVFELRTNNGTKLATLVFAGATTLGSGEATSAAPETATSIGKNRGMVVAVGSTAGTSGSVYFFVDYSEQYVAG
jgi:hypothetical protein